MSYEHIIFPKNATFLVTGGAGFIGSNLVEVLLNKGYFVRILDNLSTGKLENIKNFASHPHLEFVEGDIRDLETCLSACQGISYVLHQAAWGSVPKSIQFPLLYEEINIKGTLNMLWAAKQNDVKRFVYASSSSVYGDDTTLPKIEHHTGHPLSPYAITKKTNELYAHNFYKLYGLETIGLRYFNVFGKRQDPHSDYSAVIPKFIKLLLEDTTPTINGDGTISRDFTYIDNVVEANLLACLAPPVATGEVFNIAYGDHISLNILYQTLQQLLHKSLPPIYGPARIGDIMHSHADISKAVKHLSYQPSYSFYDGIALTIDWYKNHLN